LVFDDGAVQATTHLEGTATRTINRDFSRLFLRHFNNARVAAAPGQRERDVRVTRRPQGAIQRGWSAVINCGFSGSLSRLNSSYCICGVLPVRRNWTPSIVPTASGDAQTIYLVVAYRPRNITDIVQTDHFEITVLATSRTIDVRKLSL